MNLVDKISKEVLNLLSYSKDVAFSNINSYNNSGKLEPRLTEQQLRVISNLLDSSLNEGYQKSLDVFQKTMNYLLDSTKTTANKKK